VGDGLGDGLGEGNGDGLGEGNGLDRIVSFEFCGQGIGLFLIKVWFLPELSVNVITGPEIVNLARIDEKLNILVIGSYI
jgi:hypothetical protein